MVLEGFEGFMLPLFDALIIKIPFFSFFGFETIVDVLWSVLVIRPLKRISVKTFQSIMIQCYEFQGHVLQLCKSPICSNVTFWRPFLF